jgi:dihydrofolate synthase/folylpolyglutamate synthase
MTYHELLLRLFAARRFGVNLRLERVAAALAALGHPERRLGVVVHIGGTNGKGSTAAFVDAMWRAGGARTGLFTSPHLVRLAERFCVAGAPVDEATLVAAGRRVLAAAGAELTFFEIVTVMALVIFADARVDGVVLEVGLGGRLDATNVVDAHVACVTGVALEHQQYLGPDLAAIAGEKAGIFKPGRAAVIGAAGEAAAVSRLAELARHADVGSLVVVGAGVPACAPAGWALGLAGAYLQRNGACALAALDELARLGLATVDAAARRRGLADARCPGRLETVAEQPTTILDGAHNPHAAAVVAAALADALGSPRVVVLGVAKDKDVAGVVTPLARGSTHVIATQAATDRALPAPALAEIVQVAYPGLPVDALPRPGAALDRARQLAGPDGLVLVAGSLYLVGAARTHLLGDVADPIGLSDPVGGPAAEPVAEPR